MMSFNVKDYLKIYDNCIDLKTCKKIIRKLKKLDNWQTHKFYRSNTKNFITYDKEFSISYGLNGSQETELIHKKIFDALSKYVFEDFAHTNKWFSGWNGYSHIRYNRYDVDTRMELHCDHIHSLFDGERKGIPILSVLGVLNDDYDGGDLIFWESEKIELKAGQIMIFPSSFMFPHKVTEVTKGTRYSFISWTW